MQHFALTLGCTSEVPLCTHTRKEYSQTQTTNVEYLIAAITCSHLRRGLPRFAYLSRVQDISPLF